MTGGAHRAEPGNADAAETRTGDEPARTLSGGAVVMLREAIDQARAALEPHQWRGKWGVMVAARTAIKHLDVAFALVQPLPPGEPAAQPHCKPTEDQCP